MITEAAATLQQGVGEECADEARRWLVAARARLRIAEQLDPERELSPALALYREGIVALIAAASASARRPLSPEHLSEIGAAWRSLEHVWPDLSVDASLSQFELARTALCAPAPRLAPPVTPLEAVAICETLRRLVATLDGCVVLRTRRRAPSRRLRLRVTGIAAAAITIGAVAWWATSPKDLALHRPVTMSSVHPTAFSPKDGSGLVNGVVEYTYGAHTDVQDDPWIQIDLQKAVPIRRIVVHNRGDGWVDDAVPLAVEVGGDEKSMHPLGKRDKVFTRTDPWVIDHVDQTVRYLRFRRSGHCAIALSEVFVYDR